MYDVRSQIKAHLVPRLRDAGFKGSFPHFRRSRDQRNELLTFQLDKYGSGRFVIEIAAAPIGPFATYWGKEIPESKLTAHDLAERLRLGASPGEDCWFSFDGGVDTTVHRILDLVETQGNEYFEASA